MYTPRPAAITKYATRNVYRRNSETSGVVVDDAKSPEGAADPTVEFIVMYPRQVSSAGTVSRLYTRIRASEFHNRSFQSQAGAFRRLSPGGSVRAAFALASVLVAMGVFVM